MTDWTKIPLPGSYDDLYKHYGNPHSDVFARDFLTTNSHTIAGGEVIHVVSHVAIVQPLHDVFAALESLGRLDLIKSYAGCYVLRQIRGVSKPSLHSWGLAVDLNAPDFPLGSLKQQDPVLLKVFADAKFFWGGHFHVRKDPMHWQWTAPNTI